MSTSWVNKLIKFVEKKPIVVLRFDEVQWAQLCSSLRGPHDFSFALPHEMAREVRPSTLCLILGHDGNGDSLHLGLISSIQAVTTLETRIKITRSFKVMPSYPHQLLKILANKGHANNLAKRLAKGTPIVMLSAKLSSHILEQLATIDYNRTHLQMLVGSIYVPTRYDGAAALQENALHAALKAFGLSSADPAISLYLPTDMETGLARVRILEDSIIENDARTFPGFDFLGSSLTGRAVFEKGNDRLEIITANKRPLEHVLGVDLIYLNLSKENIVMLQYKMLEKINTDADENDWIYRPDAQLTSEIKKMKKFSRDHAPAPYEYRINPEVFYLKFVKREGSIDSAGIIMPIDHYGIIIQHPSCKGPKNGVRISYDSLSGRYLREGSFLDLIRAGYIGAYAETTNHLRALIEAILDNNKSVVAAIQRARR